MVSFQETAGPEGCGRMTIALLITLATVVWAAPTIEFRNADVSFPDDHTVRITASAAGEGVDVQSYGLRTLTKGGVNLPGLRQRGDFAFLALAADDDPD